MYKDALGTEHKTYKDYVHQARMRGESDIAYRNAEENKNPYFGWGWELIRDINNGEDTIRETTT